MLSASDISSSQASVVSPTTHTSLSRHNNGLALFAWLGTSHFRSERSITLHTAPTSDAWSVAVIVSPDSLGMLLRSSTCGMLSISVEVCFALPVSCHVIVQHQMDFVRFCLLNQVAKSNLGVDQRGLMYSTAV